MRGGVARCESGALRAHLQRLARQLLLLRRRLRRRRRRLRLLRLGGVARRLVVLHAVVLVVLLARLAQASRHPGGAEQRVPLGPLSQVGEVALKVGEELPQRIELVGGGVDRRAVVLGAVLVERRLLLLPPPLGLLHLWNTHGAQ